METIKQETSENKTGLVVETLEGKKIYFKEDRFYIDHCQYGLRDIGEARQRIIVASLWEKAKSTELEAMRIDFKFLMRLKCRWLRLGADNVIMRTGGSWWTLGREVNVDNTTGNELKANPSEYPSQLYMPTDYCIFDQRVWDEAKRQFLLWRTSLSWVSRIQLETPRLRQNIMFEPLKPD